MMEKLRALDLHYADVEARLSAPETYEDLSLIHISEPTRP